MLARSALHQVRHLSGNPPLRRAAHEEGVYDRGETQRVVDR